MYPIDYNLAKRIILEKAVNWGESSNNFRVYYQIELKFGQFAKSYNSSTLLNNRRTPILVCGGRGMQYLK